MPDKLANFYVTIAGSIDDAKDIQTQESVKDLHNLISESLGLDLMAGVKITQLSINVNMVDPKEPNGE